MKIALFKEFCAPFKIYDKWNFEVADFYDLKGMHQYSVPVLDIYWLYT